MTNIELDAVDRATIRHALRTAIAAQKHLKERVEKEPATISAELVTVLNGDIAVYEKLLEKMMKAL